MRGTLTPFSRYAHQIRPEQSKPFCGEAPPERYFLPIWVYAVLTALRADSGAGPESGADLNAPQAVRRTAHTNSKAMLRHTRQVWVCIAASMLQPADFARKTVTVKNITLKVLHRVKQIACLLWVLGQKQAILCNFHKISAATLSDRHNNKGPACAGPLKYRACMQGPCRARALH